MHTKKKLDRIFRTYQMSYIREKEQGRKDIPLRLQSYNDYIDLLVKSNHITEKKARTYCIPADLIKPRKMK